MAIFSTLFGLLGKFSSEGTPYPIFMLCALIPWQLFANGFADASNSLLVNQNLITKAYFPRLIIPLAAVLARLVDFAFALVVFLGMMFYYDVVPGFAICAAPLFVFSAMTMGLGVGLWLSALNVRYRDARHITPFMSQVWFFLSPIAYPSSLIPAQWRPLYDLNPMVAVVEGFRWTFLGTESPSFSAFSVSALTLASVLITGLYAFRRVERTVADFL
jgi:lipopolysaccharide transport system permease protein